MSQVRVLPGAPTEIKDLSQTGLSLFLFHRQFVPLLSRFFSVPISNSVIKTAQAPPRAFALPGNVQMCLVLLGGGAIGRDAPAVAAAQAGRLPTRRRPWRASSRLGRRYRWPYAGTWLPSPSPPGVDTVLGSPRPPNFYQAPRLRVPPGNLLTLTHREQKTWQFVFA